MGRALAERARTSVHSSRDGKASWCSTPHVRQSSTASPCPWSSGRHSSSPQRAWAGRSHRRHARPGRRRGVTEHAAGRPVSTTTCRQARRRPSDLFRDDVAACESATDRRSAVVEPAPECSDLDVVQLADGALEARQHRQDGRSRQRRRSLVRINEEGTSRPRASDRSTTSGHTSRDRLPRRPCSPTGQ